MTEMRTIKFGDQDWKVTPFHCVVGPINQVAWYALQDAWFTQLMPSRIGRIGVVGGWYPYPTEWLTIVAKWRQEEPARWRVHYENNPLIVNEYRLEEITLACIDDGKLIVTNFADLPGVETASKVYLPGEFWLNYAEGGAEKALREGHPRKDITT